MSATTTAVLLLAAIGVVSSWSRSARGSRLLIAVLDLLPILLPTALVLLGGGVRMAFSPFGRAPSRAVDVTGEIVGVALPRRVGSGAPRPRPRLQGRA